MVRSLIAIFCVFCVATVLSEIAGAALLWFRGQLTADTIGEIRLILAGDSRDAVADEDDVDNALPSSDDVTRRRSLAILNLSNREEQLDLLSSMIDNSRKSLLEDQKAFETAQQDFEKRLVDLKATLASDSTEQTRGILLAMSPADSVNHLMQLDLEQCVVLLKGMPEKKAATILQEFFIGAGPKNDERIKRGHEILTAIGAGEPERALIDQAAQAQAAEPQAPSSAN